LSVPHVRLRYLPGIIYLGGKRFLR
jgi:hypothetical protein